MKGGKRFNYILVSVLLCTLCIIFVGRKISQSLFFNPKDRIQILTYGQNTHLYSIGNSDGIHYIIPFDPDTKIKVPGGYGLYRIGGLSKLVDLQKDPNILKRTFSIGVSSFVPYVFYPNDTTIYYSQRSGEVNQDLPTFQTIFMGRSNVAFFDKVYLWLRFFGKKYNDFTEIDIKTKVINEDKVFLDNIFSKTFIGYFYQRKFRDEQKSIQILYQNKYQTALYLSNLIEGNGIRVNDLSQRKIGERCFIVESSQNQFSETALSLSQFFGCSLKKGKTEISDIIIYLGSIEQQWEVYK